MYKSFRRRTTGGGKLFAKEIYCKECYKTIKWEKTQKGKWCPIDPDTNRPHVCGKPLQIRSPLNVY